MYIYIQKTELKENGNFRLFAANGNGKWKFDFLGRQRYTVNDVCRFSKLTQCPSMLTDYKSVINSVILRQ